MKLNIITTGGTIDKIYFDAKSDYQIGDPVIGKLLQRMGLTVDHEIHALMRKDSLDITDADRQTIADKVNAVDSEFVLVTHGTDTMVDTGRVLKNQAPDKHIVLTGALQPAAFRETDAVFNIGCALGALQVVSAGVYVVMNGQVFDVDRVRKNVAANRFEAV